jgi:hypothetical protein
MAKTESFTGELLLTTYHPERLVRLSIDPVALPSRWNRNRQCYLTVVNAVPTEKIVSISLV